MLKSIIKMNRIIKLIMVLMFFCGQMQAQLSNQKEVKNTKNQSKPSESHKIRLKKDAKIEVPNLHESKHTAIPQKGKKKKSLKKWKKVR